MGKFGRYMERKGYKMNVEKLKVMRFRKVIAGIWREMEIMWRGELVE